MNKKSVAIIAVVLAAAAGAAWYAASGAGGSAAGAKGAAQPPTVVNVVTPVIEDVPVVVQSNGTVTALSMVDLHPQTTSTIRQVHIKEGQFVRAGELMFSFDDRSDRANVDKAQAQVARDDASLKDAERQLKRSIDLVAQKFIAQSAVDTLRSQAEAARALLLADQAALAAARVAASYGAVHAPMGGRVGAINVFPGSLVQLATSLTTITQVDPISVAFTVPESHLPKLMAAYKGGPVAVLASAGSKPVSGKLNFIDNTVDPQAGAIRVKAVFDNKDSSLWPGQYVSTSLTVQLLKNAVVLPQAAIISNTRGTFVYTAEADGTVAQRPVVRVYAFGLNAVVSGLTGKEKVITEGKQNLRAGAKVKLANAGADKASGGHGGTKDAAP
jgi:multidrug efflux system membrane fusion protein